MRCYPRSLFITASLLVLLPLAAWSEEPGIEEPKTDQVVEELHDALLGTMKQAEELGYRGRYQKLEPALTVAFDLHFMAEKSVGRHWKKLDEADRERWVALFGRVTVANYAGRFEGFSGQSFETIETVPAAHETWLVRTKLVNPEDEDVQLNYRLRENGKGWRIIDVYLNGTVSELALRRSEYSAILKREGFDKLLSVVEEKIGEFESGAES